MTDLLIAIALICQLDTNGKALHVQNLQRKCVSEVWGCIKNDKSKRTDYAKCIKPKRRK